MTQTVEEARQKLDEKREGPHGTVCPCCDQMVKVYQRAIYAMPVRALLELFRLDYANPGDYHIRDLNVDIGGSDFSKLKYWELIDKCPNNDPEKRSSGLWSITEQGKEFVLKELEVPKYCYVYNDTIIRFSDETIGVVEALGKKFSYSEIMGWLPDDETI